jgi:predicted acylesterase/phospholipase RssA
MLEQALAFASRRRLLDYTLPVTSLFASGKLTALLRSLFADTRIEDLWRPYFCVSTNLSRAQPVLHRQGPLWEAVRASTAIPGVFSPILYQGDVLVDGGVMNNCPVDLMRQACGHGVVIGVSVSPLSEKAVEYAFGPSLSGWQVFFSRFFPFARPIRAPSLVGTLMRATAINSAHHIKAVQEMADVFIQPSVGRFGILDFENYEQIAQAGYESARPHIQAWKTTWQKLA